MMGFLLMLIFMFFIINNLDIKLIQCIYQNFLFIIIFKFLLKISCEMGYYSIYYSLGVDMISFSLIMLSLWIMSLSVLVSVNNLMSVNYKYYLNILNFMLIFLLVCFMSMNLLLFYMFFEASLIPMFMLIMGWGMQVDRIQAGFYMMLYTLFGSMPLFLMIMMLYNVSCTMIMSFLVISVTNLYMYMALILAFLVKLPMYMVHLWLPKAHVEAPLVGSMILAGVMLKLGAYGLMRFMMMMNKMCMSYNKIIMIISLIGGVYSGLLCLCQSDMKMLVAYSSIVHMSILLSGMMTLFYYGVIGSLVLMISHGLCSSGMFGLVNLNYERLNSRSLLINKGLNNLLPSLSLIWFLMCSSNMSFPPSLNLWGEIMLLNSLVMWNLMLMVMMGLILFLSASYSLYIYSFSQHGGLSGMNLTIKGIYVSEFMGLLMHWIPLNFLFIIMYMYLF